MKWPNLFQRYFTTLIYNMLYHFVKKIKLKRTNLFPRNLKINNDRAENLSSKEASEALTKVENQFELVFIR